MSLSLFQPLQQLSDYHYRYRILDQHPIDFY